MAITSWVRILASVGMIIFAGAVTAGATGAFFSDSETSNANSFTAGSVDLSIGSRFSSTSNGNGQFALETDNAGRTLYTFTDLKPGDSGQGAFDLMGSSNEAFLCAKQTFTLMPENDRIETEVEAGDLSDGDQNGELQSYLQFAIYSDENENGVFDSGEPLNVNGDLGDGNGFTSAEIAAAGWISAADPTAPNTWLIDSSILPGESYSAGFMYCFGDFDSTGACIMPAGDQNDAQTDGLVGSIEFQAVQSRNNSSFTCSSLNA